VDSAVRRILSMGPMPERRPWSTLCGVDFGNPVLKGGEQLPNPLAIGVTIGGLLLELIAPRPKPRAGQPSVCDRRAVPRTPRRQARVEAHDGLPVVARVP
jgi:hypothetical protein